MDNPADQGRHGYGYERLRKLVQATCIRRTKSLVQDTLSLPAKAETQELLELDEGDIALYTFFKRSVSLFATKALRSTRRVRDAGANRSILPLIGILRLICDHGHDLLPMSALQAWRAQDADSIDWQTIVPTTKECILCGHHIEETEQPETTAKEFTCGHVLCPACCGSDGEEELLASDGGERCQQCAQKSPVPRSSQTASASSHVTESNYRPSAKVRALLRNIRVHQSTPNGPLPPKR